MRIYDNKTPEGRKVDIPDRVICSRCQGRDGRHVLISERVTSKNARGHNQTRSVTKQCPNGG